VGLLRGLDRVALALGEPTLTSLGVALVDAGGCDHIYRRADAFQRLKYRVCVFRDDDKQPDEATEEAFIEAGGSLFKWRDGRALEDELFLSLTDNAVFKLIERAEELHSSELIDDHITFESAGSLSLIECKSDLNQTKRLILAKAARSKKNSWFKTVSWMEAVVDNIVAADSEADEEFWDIVNSIGIWILES
jgi:putative ATP-dependent endonuclease of the OLD family